FALALRYQIDDLHSVAAEAITDGSDDKKCDMLHIDLEEELAVVAQCYTCSKQKASAPSNKASDLNTAVGWLLQRPLKELPVRLRQLAQELRTAIEDGHIRQLQFWYIHNLPESSNVQSELKTVEASAKAALVTFPNNTKVQVSAHEIGREHLREWYSDTLSPILVSDTIEIDIDGGFEIKGENWKAYVAPVPARVLSTLYRKHKAKLFSANVRDYLGSRRSDANINNGIKKSAENSPGDFWVYNNGITVLVNSYELIEKNKKKKLEIKGISIVNGAQTTGAIGSLSKLPSHNVMVPARFVQAPDPELVRNVIQFNNSQNKITASDFRSTDRIQKKLKDQIAKIPAAEYEGGRRGGHLDVISRNKNLLPSYTVGQALASFHGDPVVAYNQKTNIWVSDKLYARYFPEDITGAHVVFAYSLLRSVEEAKKDLVAKFKTKHNSLTSQEETLLEYFRHRGSTYLLVAAIAGSLETVLGHKIPNRFKTSFDDNTSPVKGSSYWSQIVKVTSPFSTQLSEAFSDGLKNSDKVSSAQNTFRSLVQATSGANSSVFDKFRKFVSVSKK
ncbi:MAG: AIPR family protein, partial [Proteobacteria bacterium]|nr:AIPR family protein [Pseudomonadota bacterium]